MIRSSKLEDTCGNRLDSMHRVTALYGVELMAPVELWLDSNATCQPLAQVLLPLPVVIFHPCGPCPALQAITH